MSRRAFAAVAALLLLAGWSFPWTSVGIGGKAIAPTAPTSSQVLAYDGTQWAPSFVTNSHLQPYTAQTTDSTTWVTITTLPLAVNQGVLVYDTVIGLRATGDMALVSSVVAWRRVGSAAPAYSTTLAAFYSDTAATGGNAPFVFDASLATVSFRHTVSGNSVLEQVKGVDGVVIDWTMETPTFLTSFTLP